VPGSTPASTTEHFVRERARWQPIVASLGLKQDSGHIERTTIGHTPEDVSTRRGRFPANGRRPSPQ
ncbi:MAG: hypothetical protein AB7S93_26970, partial [Xanthobacteraceae bacterium]